MSQLKNTVLQIIKENNLRYKWNEKISLELKDIELDSKKSRKDLTKTPFITIDGPDAKDFDDAIFCRRNNSKYILSVAIADVAEIIKYNSEIDKEAQKRGTSIYFPSKVIPMLPEKISNDLCSLVPNENRNVVVCDIFFSLSGEIESYIFFEGKIKSHFRMTYKQVDEYLNHVKSDMNENICLSLDNLNSLTKILLTKRSQRHALEIDNQEPNLKINQNGKVNKIVLPKHYFSHQMIEEAMLSANICAANFMKKNYSYGIYRVHEEPDEIKLETLKNFFHLKGFSINYSKNSLGTLTECIKFAKKNNLKKVLQTLILQSLKRAEYSTKEIGHFGLQLERYSHFTSPIRRYPDLMTHRMIKNIVNKEKIKFSKDRVEEDCSAMSECERIAEKSSRQVIQQMICYLLKEYIGNQFNTVITAITEFGLFAEIEDFYISGLIHVTDLPGDRYFYNKESNYLIGKRSGRTYKIGQEIRVTIANVIPDERKITLVPLSK